MKEPDKIYICRFSAGKHGFKYSLTPDQYSENTEYIRKDALLEWAKLNLASYNNRDGLSVADNIMCDGRQWAFQEFIDKLNSI